MASACLASTNPVWKWVHGLGGLGLVLLGLADNTPFISAPPGSEDVFVVLLAWHSSRWWAYYAFMATLGEVAGGYLTYRLAERGGETTLERKVGKARAEHIYRWFARSGVLAVTVGALLPPPFPFTSVIVAAGVMHYPRRKFLTSLVIGRSVRFVTVAYLGRTYGVRIVDYLAQNSRRGLYVGLAVAILSGVLTVAYYSWRRDHRKCPPG